MEHILTILHPANEIPSKMLPDGAITGNGDVTAILGGTADRVQIYIGKSDFWKSDCRAYTKPEGGFAPLGIVEILLPHLAYAEYKVEQNMDKGYIELILTAGKFTAAVKVTVCAVQNTVIFELDHTHPVVSSSISLLSVEGSYAITESGTQNGIQYIVRGFDTLECRYPTYGICTLKQISRSVSNGRERIVWASCVCTNHDTAAYRHQAIERAIAIDESDCQRLLTSHEWWWKRFWAKSSVDLPDETLELHWYAGIYVMACCARNKKFPPGLWGYSTSDGMAWRGDYHLNYNYEAPFYALVSSNHTELLECYFSPLNDHLPIAKQYAKEFLGISGAYFPVAIGPLGGEFGVRPDTKEHGRMFLGQKSNGAYATVIPMMHWYATRDEDFARREYYDFLLSVAEFWENYLVFEDGEYHIYNDCLHEVEWWKGPTYMPQNHLEKNCILSLGLVRMLMRLIIDLSETLQLNTERIPRWQHILEHLRKPATFESEGEKLLRTEDNKEVLDELSLRYLYPAGEIGKYSTLELFEIARNTHRRCSCWDHGNIFCEYYPMAARLEYPPEEIISHIHEVLEKRARQNGTFNYGGGGLENNAAIPMTVNEMLLQSYEGIIRLFPVWDRNRDAKFSGLRANGAFLVNGSVENGIVYAEIMSEQGMPLTVEAPENGYVLVMGDGRRLEITDKFITVDTQKGETVRLMRGERRC